MKPALFSRGEKLLLFCLASVQFTHIVDFMILMPLGPQLMRSFELSAQQFGLLVSCYTFAAAIMGVSSALFIDRLDRKKLFIALYFGFAIGTLACGFSPSYLTLLISRTLTGAFGGVLTSLSLAIVADAIGPDRRATATSFLMMAFSIASIMGVPLAIALAQAWDWHGPFLVIGSLSLVIGFFFFKWVPPLPSTKDPVKQENPFEPVLRVFTNRNQMIALSFMFLLVMGQFTVVPFISPALVANAGLPENQLPLIYLIGGLFSIFSGPVVGRMADKYGKKRVFFWGALVSMGPLFVLTNLGPTPTPIILGVVALLFVCMGGRMIPATALVTSAVVPQHRGSFMSMMSSTQQFASALASFIAGAIVVRADDGSLQNYPQVGYIALIASAMAIFLIKKIKPIEGDDR